MVITNLISGDQDDMREEWHAYDPIGKDKGISVSWRITGLGWFSWRLDLHDFPYDAQDLCLEVQAKWAWDDKFR